MLEFVPDYVPRRTAEMLAKQPHEHEPLFASFVRPSIQACLDLAEHLRARGFHLVTFHEDDVVVAPVREAGEFLDTKMITVYDDGGKNAGEFIERMHLPEADTAALRKSFERIASQIGSSDWRLLTSADCAGKYERPTEG